MNENSFDFFSDSELSQIMSTIPPDDNITKSISPWRKATRQMLIGFALMAVVPQIFPLNINLPIAGSISMFLGFRSLRKENRWFFLRLYSELHNSRVQSSFNFSEFLYRPLYFRELSTVFGYGSQFTASHISYISFNFSRYHNRKKEARLYFISLIPFCTRRYNGSHSLPCPH